MKLNQSARFGNQVFGDMFALEIEAEGRNLPLPNQYWNAEHDGSLRGESMEYVSKGGMSVEHLTDSLLYLNDLFKEAKTELNFSFRTSVHLHMNMQDEEIQTVYNTVLLYLLFEEAMVNYSGDGRKGNRFCLRVRDSYEVVTSVMKLFLHSQGDLKKGYFRQIFPGEVRYASLNIASLIKFGTLEFRSLRGTSDPAVILPWVSMAFCLKTAAKKFKTHRSIREYLVKHGPEKLANSVFGKGFFDKYLRYEGFDQDVEYNLSLITPLFYEVDLKCFDNVQQEADRKERILKQIAEERARVIREHELDEQARGDNINVVNAFEEAEGRIGEIEAFMARVIAPDPDEDDRPQIREIRWEAV